MTQALYWLTELRKDNYAVAVTDHGDVYGKVLSVSKDAVVLATDGGAPARVEREFTARISANQYRDAAGTTADTFARSEGVVRPQVKATDLFATEVEDLTEEPVVDEPETPVETAPKTDKKALCAAIFAEVFNGSKESAKETKRRFQEVGCTPHGANTYFYNFKHGKWTA